MKLNDSPPVADYPGKWSQLMSQLANGGGPTDSSEKLIAYCASIADRGWSPLDNRPRWSDITAIAWQLLDRCGRGNDDPIPRMIAPHAAKRLLVLCGHEVDYIERLEALPRL